MADRQLPLRERLKVIVFDLDGVLVDNVAYEQKNLEYIADMLVEQEGVSYVEAQDKLDSYALKYRGKRQAHDWRVLCRELGLGNVWYDAHIANLRHLVLIEGADGLLAALKGKVTLALGTDAIDPVADIKLAYLGLKKYFDKIYTQDTQDSFKGEPRYYEKIAQATGVQLSEMMYVGNRPERGIDTAQRLGMYTVLVPHPEHLQLKEKIPADVHPDLETKDFYEVREYVLKLTRL